MINYCNILKKSILMNNIHLVKVITIGEDENKINYTSSHPSSHH